MSKTPVDDCLRVLASGPRRRVVEYLREGRGRASVDELVAHLEERPDAPPVGGRQDRDRTRVAVVQVYLPPLADHGVVDWDRREGEVRYRGDEVVEAVLDALATASVRVEV